MNLRFLGILAVAASLASISTAQITKQGGGYLLRMKFAKGAKMSYSMVVSGNASGNAFSMNTPMTMTVTSTSGTNGTLAYSVGPMKMTMNGTPMNAGASQPMKSTVTMDNRGKVLGGGAGSSPSGSITLPAQPIPVGGTWSGSTSVAGGPGGAMKVSGNYKLLGITSVNGISCARIAVTLTGSGASSVSGSGTIYLAVSDGSLVKNDTKMSVKTPQLPKPMAMTMTINRR